MLIDWNPPTRPTPSFDMRIWLATVGEPIRIEGENKRLLRTGQFAYWLAEKGHDVTFLTNTMDHYARRQRFDRTTELREIPGFRTVCLWGRPYKKSISYARMRSHSDTARSFREWSAGKIPPDAIISAYPIVELCAAMADYAVERNIPIVMDCRDAWPDIFYEMLPAPLRGLGRFAGQLLERRASHTLARADALTAHSRGFLNWALAKAARPQNSRDFVFPFTYSGKRKAPRRAASESSQKLVVFFAGTMTKRNGLDKFIEVAARLPEATRSAIDIRIAGTGEDESRLRKLATDLAAPVSFLGWIDQDVLHRELITADYGLLPYDRPDFEISIPNKVAEYLSAGLPLLSSTKGEVAQLIADYGCGIMTGESAAEITISMQNMLDKLASNWPAQNAGAKTAFEQNFDGERVFSQALVVLEKLVSVRAS